MFLLLTFSGSEAARIRCSKPPPPPARARSSNRTIARGRLQAPSAYGVGRSEKMSGRRRGFRWRLVLSPLAEGQYRAGVPPNVRRFLPLILIAVFLLILLPTLLKKKTTSSSNSACHPGQSATCSNADLVAADLSSANLTSANFAHADLADADLHSANLSGANLTGADISGADLAGATLTHARLRGANLTGADLTGAIHADLLGAVECHTLLPTGRFPVPDC